MHFRLSLVASTAAVLALGACADQGTLTAPAAGPSRIIVPDRGGDRLATIEWEGSTPTLYLQDVDGANRVRVHFDHVSDHVTGNYSPRQLPVTDASIVRISRVKWSPDGRYLAVMVQPASDAMQVVLVASDGLALRTVSPNSQYLWGDVDWSPDGRRIAYMMATGPYGSRPDIFVTQLGPDNVTRVTTGARLSGYDALRFDATGTQIFFTEHLGWAEDGVNSLSRIAVVDLATGTVARGDTVVGEPQGFARDGSWALFIRTASTRPYVRELFRLPENGGKETVLASGPDLGSAAVAEGDREAVLSAWSGDWPTFSIVGLDQPGDVRGRLATSAATTWAALRRGQ